ncbi:MAG: hypothetical protein QOJ15_4082 [Bradyrhizobium sp.]|jgi:hypothetical protein|nr:hypothetical protein [Bradyrhizobium sp.]
MQFAEAKQGQRAEHGDKGDGVDQEYPARTDGGDQGAGDGWTDHPRGVERGRIQRHRIRQVGFPDQLGDECMARRRVECRNAAEQECKHIDLPQLDQPGDGEDTEAKREHSHRRLGREQELAPVEVIGGKSGQGQQEKMGAGLQGQHHAHGCCVVVGQLRQHEPALGDALHPRSYIGHQRASGPQPIIETPQRTKNALHLASLVSPGELPP